MFELTLKQRKITGITGSDAPEPILFDLVRSGPRQDILTALIDTGDKGRSFRSLSRICNLKPTSLAYHLKVLVSRGGVRKEFRYQEAGREFSFYILTDPGRSAVSTSMDLLEIGRENGVCGMDKVIIIHSAAAPRLLLIKDNRM